MQPDSAVQHVQPLCHCKTIQTGTQEFSVLGRVKVCTGDHSVGSGNSSNFTCVFEIQRHFLEWTCGYKIPFYIPGAIKVFHSDHLWLFSFAELSGQLRLLMKCFVKQT